MAINQTNINFSFKNQILKICKIGVTKNDKDLYFIDKSFDNFKISIHRDGSVWFSPQNKWKKRRKHLIFKFNWKNMEKDIEKEKPFLWYVPSDLINYPIQEKRKNNSAEITISGNMSCLDRFIISFFLINDKAAHPQGRETDINKNIYKMEMMSTDGKLEKKEDKNPFFKFKNQRIRFNTILSNYGRETKLLKYHFLYICEPSSEINISDIIKNNIFTINFEELQKCGIAINSYTYNKKNIYLLIY